MKLFNFENIKNASIYVTPNFENLRTKRYKVGIQRILKYVLLYSFVIILLVSLIYAFTPAKKLILYFDNEKINEQAERIEDLEKKVLFLSHELESMASTNEKLKYALMLGTVDSLDTNSAVYDSLKTEKVERLPLEGNIFKVFLKLFSDFSAQSESSKPFPVLTRPADGIPVKFFDPESGHLGIDLALKSGSPVFAASGGLVIVSEYSPEAGYKLVIDHGNGCLTIYKHCLILMKKERDRVIPGELIALSGNSGVNTSGPHLHFEIWKDGKAVDPAKLLVNLAEKK